jgi:hypothetical protein
MDWGQQRDEYDEKLKVYEKENMMPSARINLERSKKCRNLLPPKKRKN